MSATSTDHASQKHASGALPHEREAKFVLTRPADATAPAETLAQHGARFGPCSSVTHIDTYLDTPSFDLYRRGLSLRLRRRDDKREIGLKQIDGLDGATIQQRLDFSVDLEPTHTIDRPAAWPKAIVQALRPLVGNLSDLHPLIELHQVRHKRIISAPAHGDRLAEWSVDRVEIRLPSQQDDSPALGSFDELEVELLDPDGNDIFAAWIDVLTAMEELRPAASSKFARSFRMVMQRRCHPHQDAAPTTDYRRLPLAEACRAILCDQLGEILHLEAGVRAGNDAEAIHAMRVAIRRARAAFHLFGHCFRPKTLRRHTRGLRALGRILGPVRDLDVALSNLNKQRKQMPAAARDQLQPLRKALRAKRKAAHAALIEYLDGDEQRAFITAFSAFCTTPGRGIQRPKEQASEELLPTQVRHTLPSIILRCFEQVRAYETALAGAPLPPLATFHALRIQAKYLRYSLEFAADLLGEPGSVLIPQLKQLQDHLGALNDTHVEQQRLAEWAAALEQKDVLALRTTAIEAAQRELMATAPAKLAQATSPHSRMLLGAALANI